MIEISEEDLKKLNDAVTRLGNVARVQAVVVGGILAMIVVYTLWTY